MPTNDERREVAEIMRNGTRFSPSSCAVASRLGLECEEFETCGECEKELAHRLADLIEPERADVAQVTHCCPCGAQRTCRIEPIKSGSRYLVSKYTCCGYELVDSLTDPHASSIPEGYCPNCGAKVVQE